MAKLFAGLFAAALVIGLGSAPTLTYAEEDPTEGAEEGATNSDDGSMKEEAPKEESMMEKLEGLLKEEPTDEEKNPIVDSEGTDN